MESRLIYRAQQFWNALTTPKNRVPDSALLTHLAAKETILFRRMQPSEQFHSYQVLTKLVTAGHLDRDLLTAALLHDVGKVLYPLSLFDRVMIVLGRRFFPGRMGTWAKGKPTGWMRPFVVAENHPQWGADLAEKAGVSRRAVEIIRRHQDKLPASQKSETDRLIHELQVADDAY